MTTERKRLMKQANDMLNRDWKWKNELRLGAKAKSQARRKAERKARLNKKTKSRIVRERL